MKYCIIFILSIFFSCDPIPVESEKCHRNILIKNNSEQKLWVREGSSMQNQINCNSPLLVIGVDLTEKLPSTLTSCWEELMPNLFEGAIALYFVDHIVTPCDSIDLNQNVVERREYTVDDLNDLDWTVEYP